MNDRGTSRSRWIPPPDDLLAAWAPRAARGSALDLGAGDGEVSRWLLQEGFSVDAVESDPARFARLEKTLASSRSRRVEADIRRLPLRARHYSLVTALAFLHFFHPDELDLLARRIMRALGPGGILLASAFTTDDPGFEARRKIGEEEIAPATFRLAPAGGVIHYFGPGEFARLFLELEILESDEGRRLSPTGLRSGATLVARKNA
jgi:SAM-dependent methyltransferase